MGQIIRNVKKFRLVRRVLVGLSVFVMSFGSFAAIVADNDSSAFITKAEFAALKHSFDSQINSYFNTIDAKIDYVIANYLNNFASTVSGEKNYNKLDALPKVNGKLIKNGNEAMSCDWHSSELSIWAPLNGTSIEGAIPLSSNKINGATVGAEPTFSPYAVPTALLTEESVWYSKADNKVDEIPLPADGVSNKIYLWSQKTDSTGTLQLPAWLDLKATDIEAKDGVIDDKYMTPKQVKDNYQEKYGGVLLATYATREDYYQSKIAETKTNTTATFHDYITFTTASENPLKLGDWHDRYYMEIKILRAMSTTTEQYYGRLIAYNRGDTNEVYTCARTSSGVWTDWENIIGKVSLQQMMLDTVRPVGSFFIQYSNSDNPNALFNDITKGVVSSWEKVIMSASYIQLDSSKVVGTLITETLPNATGSLPISYGSFQGWGAFEPKQYTNTGSPFNTLAIGGSDATRLGWVYSVNTGDKYYGYEFGLNKNCTIYKNGANVTPKGQTAMLWKRTA